MLNSDNLITVTITRGGFEPKEVQVADRSTVEALLERAQITPGEGEVLFCNGERAEATNLVEDGDVYSLSKTKEGN